MREIKKAYIEPVVEITEFECEDIITASAPTRELKTSTVEGSNYVNIGTKSWLDALK